MCFSSAILVLLIASCYNIVVAQVPRACSDPDSIANKTCCPTFDNSGECGSNVGRGTCQDIQCHYYQNSTDPNTDPRVDWPSYFFTRACSCNGNYAGFDCGECKFGYTGDNCTQKIDIRVRKSMNDPNVDWTNYVNILKKAKETPSRYVILHFNESIARTRNEPVTDYVTQNVSLYDLFVWMHHYVAKTNRGDYEPTGSAMDNAHESAGFLTWHRLFLLWLEREIQMSLDQPDFTLYYWDWTVPENRDSLFVDDRLGGNDGTGNVTGNFNGDEWQTVCWFLEGSPNTCNLTDPEGIHSLIRCPNTSSCDPNSNYAWPSSDSVTTMLSFSMYRNPNEAYPFNKFANQSFSNYLEGFIPELETEKCDLSSDENLNTNCQPNGTDIAVTRTLHNLVHITLGIGYLKNVPNLGISLEAGTMADVAASPNDPVFLNHHTMIDCLFEQWLQKYPQVTEYVGPDDIQFAGHGIDDCIVPFIPMYTHKDMFKRASEFGYSCNLPAPPGNNNNGGSQVEGGGLLLILFLIISIATLY